MGISIDWLLWVQENPVLYDSVGTIVTVQLILGFYLFSYFQHLAKVSTKCTCKSH